MIPFLSVKPSAIKVKVRPQFPAQLIGGTAIAVSKVNGVYTVNLNYQELQAAAISSPTHNWVAWWDDVSGQFFRAAMSDLAAIIGTGYVLKSGDTMTGPLVLPGAPTLPNQAATKGYVDGIVPPATPPGGL